MASIELTGETPMTERQHMRGCQVEVVTGLIRKAANALNTGAQEITVWGTGTPRRELLYSDDLAQACVFLLNLPDSQYDTLLAQEAPPLINIGTGEDVSIRELAELVARTVGFEGKLAFDPTMPDGTPRKCLDVSRIHALGWHHSTNLEDGISRTWELVRHRLVHTHRTVRVDPSPSLGSGEYDGLVAGISHSAF